MPIDVLYLGEHLEIVGMEETLKPRTVGKYQQRAFSVLELPVGTIRETGTKIGHYLNYYNEKEFLQMLKKIKALFTEEQGQGMTEYGLVFGIIAVAVVGILTYIT